MRDPPNHDIIIRYLDTDEVDPVHARPEQRSENAYLQTFGGSEVLDRIEIRTKPGLHFDGDPLGSLDGKQIDLAATDAYVAFQNPQSTPFEKRSGKRFANASQPGQVGWLISSELAGSSSSMFTSRKVITLTCLTNRAGRYMSHTHASSSSSSK